MNSTAQATPLADWVGMAGLMDHIAVRSRTTVYELIEAGMPVHQPLPNGRLWFDLHEVDAWLRNR